MLPAIVHGSSYNKKSVQKTQALLNTPTKPINADELEASLYRSMYTFLIISEICICRPYGAHQHKPTNSRCDQLLLLLQLIWSILIYVILIVAMYSEFTQSNVDLPTVQKPLYLCEYIFYLLHTFYIIFTSFSCHHRIRRLIRTIAEFDETLSCSFDNTHSNYNRLTRFLRIHMLFILLYFIVTVIVIYFYCKGEFIPYIRALASYVVSNTILCFSLIQYYTFLYVTSQRANRLNKILIVEFSQKASSKVLWQKLQRIRLLYSALQVFTKDVNNLYAPSVVLIYIGSITNFSVNLFLLYKLLDETNELRLVWIMFSGVWSCLHIAKMFLIIYYNCRVEEQKSNAMLLMNEIKAQNAEMEESVTHFTMQLAINTRSNVVCGVAVLDMSFVTSILVGVTTLFIFLLQYDITYDALMQTRIAANLN
ncbi:putative gustatory receptor 59f isoform X1 [Eurosta solidaginis]|uniref:putative gustatory receptor 59f isoform X1 n=1 Tax=Eurosta solidaginis TaxID=178769 RepID=UPI0035310DF0